MTWEAHSFEAWSRVGRSAKGGDLHSSRPRAAGRSSKRALDLLIAVTALILLSPLLLIVAMIVKISDRGRSSIPIRASASAERRSDASSFAR